MATNDYIIANIPRKHEVCLTCGMVARPKKRTKGSFLIEILLWCFFGFGIFYSLWRLSTREDVCPYCRGNVLVPPRSPRGVMALQQMGYR